MADRVSQTQTLDSAEEREQAQRPQSAPADQSEQLASKIEEIPPADAAAVMAELPPPQAADVAEYLDPETAAHILAKMDTDRAATVIRDMEAPEASLVLQHMDPDDRVDVLERVERPLHDQLVSEMDAEHADETRRLEQYLPDTAGGIMTTQVTALYEYITVDDAITLLRKLNQELEQMYYVYVIDSRRHLVGVLSMRDLILSDPNKRLRDIMITNVRSVPATMDQEQVAQLMRKYGYLALPVVDEQNKLIGLITLDDVVDVLQEEATEDVQRMFGAGAEERLTSSWQFSFKKRVWWLIVNLATAFLAAAVVAMFEDTIAKLAILAAYMPIVAGMGGNASAQAMAVTVRGLAVGRVDRALMRHVLISQTLVGITTGVVIGLITMAIAVIFHISEGVGKTLALGGVVCAALIINHTLACVSGAAIPFILKHLGFDPAQSATIFATTITDVVGFLALLGLAKLFLL
ncbi:magnesium transporter [Fontivita pretiosa]|uniref:magnesium transporter n=1 Tax=Fontivita pretiosa TaxID=2989684 RepID=UPI003D16593C